MPAYVSDKLQLKITTPLGKDTLILHQMEGIEELSSPFFFTLQCHSAKSDITADALVGKEAGFSVRRQDGSWRDFHGIISTFAPVDDNSGQCLYRLRIVPWLWCLTLSSDCRVYQQKDIKEILADLFQRHGFSDYDFSGLTRTYEKREYCVQYNESAFNFASRLMEDEGVFYWFRHESARHVLVLGDSPSAYKSAADADLAFRKDPQSGGGDDLLTAWERESLLTTGFFSARDYNYEQPDCLLEGKSGKSAPFEKMDTFEAYRYPIARLDNNLLGTALEQNRDSAEAASVIVTGSGHARSFSPGATFTLTNHPSPAEAGNTFVITRVEHMADGSRQQPGQHQPNITYSNSFQCVPAKLTVRPDRRTARPSMRGVETAVVVGPSGEEIHTDEMGRIKIQFHWDRTGKSNEESSCWVRVSQPLAGSGWGIVAVPRIGQEVVVSFIDGSPDRPLVTGAVYNGLNALPYDFPAEKTKTVFRTRSTPNGASGNELTFDDEKDGEEILLHGERDLTVTIKNDAESTIDNDCRFTIGNDAATLVENNSEVTINGESKRSIGGSETVEVTKDAVLRAKTVTIDAQSKITFKVGSSNIEVTASGITIKAAKIEIKADASATMGAPKVDVKADAMLTLDGAMVMIG